MRDGCGILMSNCIKFYNDSPFIIPTDALDQEGFKALYNEHYEHQKYKQIPVDDWFCWFVNDSYKRFDGDLRIWFGTGKSDHTWRDFMVTLVKLSGLVLPDHTIDAKLNISDEYDGHSTIDIVHITLKHGRAWINSREVTL